MFEGVAHEALSECMGSLQSASDAIKNKKVNLGVTKVLLVVGKLLSSCEQILTKDVSVRLMSASTRSITYHIFHVAVSQHNS